MRLVPPLAAAAALALPLISGCTTYRETQPAQAATQQLLTSHAAEIAADKLATALPAHGAVFVDASHFKGEGSDYALSAIDAAFLRHGLVLTPDKKGSKVTVELRMGALSIDQKDTVFGLPAGSLPIPGTITAFPIPEISFYSSYRRTGKAEFAAFAYETASGKLIAVAEPQGGERQLVEKRYLTLIHTGQHYEEPGVVQNK
jgi:hypothetical protein